MQSLANEKLCMQNLTNETQWRQSINIDIFFNICEEFRISIPYSISIFVFPIFNSGIVA